MRIVVALSFALLLMLGCLHAEDRLSCLQIEGIDICLAEGVVLCGKEHKALDASFSRQAVFAEDASGSPQIVRTEFGNVIAVVDPVPIPGRDECATTIRGIVVTHAGIVRLSPRIQNVSLCAHGPWDEKMFIIFGKSALKE